MGKIRRKQVWLLIFLGAVLLALLVGLVAFKAVQKSAEQTRHYSAMSWLSLAVSQRLQQYYEAHSYYPSKLTDLQIPFPGDGASPEMLQGFEYSTDGKSYEMSWHFQYGNEVHLHKEFGCDGQKRRSERWVNGKLRYQTDW